VAQGVSPKFKSQYHKKKKINKNKIHIPFFFFFVVLGLELGAFTLSHSTTQPYFGGGFFEIGAHKLFAWAGFEQQSS
jgi:hypothetical protein